ncbi:hypothetical protein FHR72_001729 [Mycolicibacterium iranicum]|uniref:Uncharacterized protein n=1 Tax=Mycolicibacterium iranicum TaxID=912594 RepID=A0A839QCM4_MYCIR|nr:hypothetical protein [Mycolicibacterium iranicum]MBB2990261.1 hypothetical protein [Mycolicibacterium iranicum]
MAAPEGTATQQPAKAAYLAEFTGHADILDCFGALYGDTAGFLHVATGSGIYVKNGKPAHRDWSERCYEYPAQAGQAARDIAQGAPACDIYVCSSIMRGRTRTKGAAARRSLVHADIDAETKADLVRAVDGFAIASGTPGHAHVYVPVAEELTVTEFEALCRGLGDYFGGGDAKISDNDFLRPVGTFNHKPTLSGGEPSPVTWLVTP